MRYHLGGGVGEGGNSPPLEINEDIELSKNLFTHTNSVD